MIYVFNKEKIIAYVVSIFTVVILFSIASISPNQEIAIETSSTTRLLPIYSVDTDEEKVAFTMNCAWSADDIDQILEVLAKNDVKITFFIVGTWAKEYPEAVEKIYNAGHEIASHSNTHPHVNDLSYEENVAELLDSSNIIENIIDDKINLYRAPYGEYNDTVIQVGIDNGYYTIQWSLDTLDYEGLTGEEMWDRLKNSIKPGDIILSHNGTDHTADSLDLLINNIQDEGLEIVTVSELIYMENYTINSNGEQSEN